MDGDVPYRDEEERFRDDLKAKGHKMIDGHALDAAADGDAVDDVAKRAKLAREILDLALGDDDE